MCIYNTNGRLFLFYFCRAVPKPERYEQQVGRRLFRSRGPAPEPAGDTDYQAAQVHQRNGSQHRRGEGKSKNRFMVINATTTTTRMYIYIYVFYSSRAKLLKMHSCCAES